MKCSGTVEWSWAIAAEKGMWYQVVSPPNMPKSRLDWVGKVHSATVKEATPIAIRRAIVSTRGAATSRRSPGALERPSQAAPRPTPTQKTTIQPK